MQTFPLRYPGNMLDPDALPRDIYTQVNNLLKLLGLHLADAAIRLHLYEHRELVTDLWSRDEVEHVQGCAHGHAAVAYSYRLACIYAHTVLYALDGIQKALSKLAEIPGVPARLAEVRDADAVRCAAGNRQAPLQRRRESPARGTRRSSPWPYR